VHGGANALGRYHGRGRSPCSDQPDRRLQRRRPWMKLRCGMSKGGAMARPLRILVVLIGLGALLLAPRAAAQETLVVEIARRPG
jgi:hypothetical protein